MKETTFVYVTDIASTPQNVWAALTSGEQSQQHWFGFRIESAWRVGKGTGKGTGYQGDTLQ